MGSSECMRRYGRRNGFHPYHCGSGSPLDSIPRGSGVHEGSTRRSDVLRCPPNGDIGELEHDGHRPLAVLVAIDLAGVELALRSLDGLDELRLRGRQLRIVRPYPPRVRSRGRAVAIGERRIREHPSNVRGERNVRAAVPVASSAGLVRILDQRRSRRFPEEAVVIAAVGTRVRRDPGAARDGRIPLEGVRLPGRTPSSGLRTRQLEVGRRVLPVDQLEKPVGNVQTRDGATPAPDPPRRSIHVL